MQKSLKYFMEIRRKPGSPGPWKRSLMNMPLAAKEMSRPAWLRRRLNSRDSSPKDVSPRHPPGQGRFINVPAGQGLYMIFTNFPEPLTKSRFDSIVLVVFIHID
jgi:hypothetical protein